MKQLRIRIRRLEETYKKTCINHGSAKKACNILNDMLAAELKKACSSDPTLDDAKKILGIGWLPTDRAAKASVSISKLARGVTGSATERVIEILASFHKISPESVRADVAVPEEGPMHQPSGGQMTNGRSGAPNLVVMQLDLSPKVPTQNSIQPDETGNFHIGLSLRLFFGTDFVEFIDGETGTTYKADCRVVSGRVELERGPATVPDESILGFLDLKDVNGLSVGYIPAPVTGAPSWQFRHTDASKHNEKLPSRIVNELCEMKGLIDGTAVIRFFLRQSDIGLDLLSDNSSTPTEADKIKADIKAKVLADAVVDHATEGQAQHGQVAYCRVRLEDAD